jgi:hypothetical protein
LNQSARSWAIAGTSWQAKRDFVMNTCGRLQRLFRDIRIARQHDDGSVRVDPFHFNCNLLPIHLRHNIINDYNINRMDGRQFQAFSAAGCGQNGIPKAFEECLFRIPANFGYRR